MIKECNSFLGRLKAMKRFLFRVPNAKRPLLNLSVTGVSM